MAENKTDLVREIEEAENDVLYVAETCHKESVCWNKLKHIELTLQRARDALRWVPIEEWSRPTKESNHYEVTVLTDIERRTMGRRILFWNAVTGRWHDLDDQAMRYPTRYPVVAVKEPSAPYTPEEK